MGAAIVSARADLATEAAEFIVAHQSGLPAASIAAAQAILQCDERNTAVPGLVVPDQEAIDRKIHKLRLRLNDEPRNSVAWVDMAREYTLLGQSDRAARAIRIAVALSPLNRFILRSAARFLVHIGDAVSAHRLIRSAESTPSDPWLSAAEVALGSLAGGGAKFAKSAQRMIESGKFSSFETSELLGALGTLEAEHGKNLVAKKFFLRSLVRPTENAVAQAVWATKEIASFGFDVRDHDVPRSFEAKTWEAFTRGDWDVGLQQATNWLLDEPFSSKPAALGSYIASTTLEDYPRAVSILKTGLVANPREPILLNNLAFSLASQDKPFEAERYLKPLRLEPVSLPDEVNLLATQGLILFRKGDPDGGRKFYRKAMEKAEQGSLDRHRGRAALYLAREEIMARTAVAQLALRKALDLTGKFSDPDIRVLRERFEKLAKLYANRESSAPGSGRSDGAIKERGRKFVR
ncbi:MAG: tetratricopeptide repeat protein [Terriglobia bacterium]